jgi:uncharacterized caspase-like protein/WD40 repeat protein
MMIDMLCAGIARMVAGCLLSWVAFTARAQEAEVAALTLQSQIERSVELGTAFFTIDQSDVRVLLDGRPLNPLPLCPGDNRRAFRVQAQPTPQQLVISHGEGTGATSIALEIPMRRALVQPALPRLVSDFSAKGNTVALLQDVSADGRIVVSSEGDRVVLRESQRLREVRTLATPSGRNALRSSTPARFIGEPPLLLTAGEATRTFALWDPLDGQVVRVALQAIDINGIALDPAGGCIAVISEFTSTVTLLSSDLAPAGELDARGLSFSQAVAWSADGHRLAVVDLNGVALVWDVLTRKELVRTKANKGYSSAVAFAIDGETLWIGGSAGVASVSLKAPVAVARQVPGWNDVTHLRRISTGVLVVHALGTDLIGGAQAQRLRQWRDAASILPLPAGQGYVASYVERLERLPERKGTAQAIRRFEGRPYESFARGADTVAVTRKEPQSDGSAQFVLDMWRLDTGQPQRVLIAERIGVGDLISVAFDAAGRRFVAGSSDGPLVSIDEASGQIQGRWKPPGELIQLAGAGQAGVWAVTAPRGALQAYTGIANNFDTPPTARLPALREHAARYPSTLHQLVTPGVSPSFSLPLPGFPVQIGGADNHGRTPVLYSTGAVELREPDGGAWPLQWIEAGPEWHALALSPDSRWLAISQTLPVVEAGNEQEAVVLYRVADGRRLVTRQDRAGSGASWLSWDPKRPERLAISQRDGTVAEVDVGRMEQWAKDRPDALLRGTETVRAVGNTGNRVAISFDDDQVAVRDAHGSNVAVLQLDSEVLGASFNDDDSALLVFGHHSALLQPLSPPAAASWIALPEPFDGENHTWVDFQARQIVRRTAAARVSVVDMDVRNPPRSFDIAMNRSGPMPIRVAATPDGGLLLTANLDGMLQLIDLRQHKVVARWPSGAYPIWAGVARVPRGSAAPAEVVDVLVQGNSGDMQTWQVRAGVVTEIGRQRTRFITREGGGTLQRTADGRRLLASGFDKQWSMHEEATVRFRVDVYDGVTETSALVLAGSPLPAAPGIDLGSGRPPAAWQRLAGAVSANGRFVAMPEAGRLTVHDIDRAVPDNTRDQLWLSDAAYLGKDLYVGIDLNGALRLAPRSGSGSGMLAMHIDAQRWVAVAPDGRFDSNNLDAVPGLHWITKDTPLQPLPLELFMRDYFEPQLMRKLLDGDSLPPLRSVASLLRQRPVVRVVRVTPSRVDTRAVDVLVQVEQTAAKGRGPAERASGASDLRLFRSGQLVRSTPLDGGPLAFESGLRTQVLFERVQLPAAGSAEFSAYAFNSEGVKGDTAHLSYRGAMTKAGLPRAWLLSIGVDRHLQTAWDLSYAVADSLAMSDTLARSLRASGNFADVHVVQLAASVNGAKNNDQRGASKVEIAAALGAWAQATVAAKGPRPSPDDLVIVSFAGHGVRSHSGEFYLVPSDIGVAPDASDSPEFARTAISSMELSKWLRAIDAREFLFVLDACHSAASVQSADFKPGPMSSRGLGQLAYDKGMRILAASQVEGVAIESPSLLHGVLTYALVTEGLDGGLADWRPRDGRIQADEWLAFAADRVPQLVQEMLAGRKRGVKVSGQSQDSRPVAQRPVLFNFDRSEGSSLLRTLPAQTTD